MIDTYIDMWLTPAIIDLMGECAYQRTLSILCSCIPLFFLAFALFSCGLVLYGIYKAVSRS